VNEPTIPLFHVPEVLGSCLDLETACHGFLVVFKPTRKEKVSYSISHQPSWFQVDPACIDSAVIFASLNIHHNKKMF
jgi:hypothetical protein